MTCRKILRGMQLKVLSGSRGRAPAYDYD